MVDNNALQEREFRDHKGSHTGKQPERELVVYGPFHPTFFNILKTFRRRYPEYDINMTYYAAHPITAIERIKQEVEKGLPTADIVMLPHYATLHLEMNGYLRQYFSEESDAYPSIFKDEDGFWSAIAVEPTNAVYNPTKISSEDLPTTLGELVSPELQGMVATQSVIDRSEGMFNFYYSATLLDVIGEKKWDRLMRDFVQNVKPRAFPCYHNLYKYVARGDYAIGLPLPVIKVGWSVNTLNLKDLPSMSSLRSIAIPADAAHPNAAELFYDYLLSEEWQSKMGKEVEGLIPSRPGVKMKYGAEFQGDGMTYFPTEEAVRNADTYLEKFQQIGLP